MTLILRNVKFREVDKTLQATNHLQTQQNEIRAKWASEQ